MILGMKVKTEWLSIFHNEVETYMIATYQKQNTMLVCEYAHAHTPLQMNT